MPAPRPKFSILLLCWNHAPYLEQCIGSLAAQSERDFEIIFLDNHSTDGSFDIARGLFATHGLQAKLLSNDVPAGISRNFNRLLAESNGQLIAPLSTDDWLDLAYVATMIALADEDPAAGWLSCGGWRYFEQERRSVAIDEADFVTDRPVTDIIRDGGTPHFFVGCVYRRVAVETVGGWDEQLPIEDLDLFLRLSLRFPHRRTPRRLVNYRRTSMAASADAAFMLQGWEAFFTKHADFFGRRLRTRKSERYRSYAALLTDQGRLPEARVAIGKALRLRPWAPVNWRTLAYVARRGLKRLPSVKLHLNRRDD